MASAGADEGAAQQDEDGAVVDEAVEEDDRNRRGRAQDPCGVGPGIRREPPLPAHGALGGEPGGVEEQMRGKNGQLKGGGAQQCGRDAKVEARNVEGQNLHGRPPERHAGDGSVPRVPSWGACEVDGGAVPPCRAAVGTVVRRPGVDLWRLPFAPCLRACGTPGADTARYENVPGVISPRRPPRNGRLRDAGLLAITFVHSPRLPVAAQSVCGYGGSDGCDRSDPRGGGQAGS